VILFYILQHLHPLSLPYILSSNFNYYFPNKWYQSRSHWSGFWAFSGRMFLIDMENFGVITGSILLCWSIPRNLVQAKVCWDLSRILLPVWKQLNCFLFGDYCLAPKAQVVYFMEIKLFPYFVLNIFFIFYKDA